MSNYVSIKDQTPGNALLLTISIVTFKPNFEELTQTLNSLIISLGKLCTSRWAITIIDNSPVNNVEYFILNNYKHLPIRLLHGHGNIGFGRAHNLSFDQLGEFHLILNPDIELESDALPNAIAFMKANMTCGLLTPFATWPDGRRQYLCKRYPSLLDLFLRGFAPNFIRGVFAKRLHRYEMRSETNSEIYWNPPIVSGCLMFFRSNILLRTNGFSESYFLYFEDFDLSLRVGKISKIAFVPTVRLVHAGGNTSKKGFWHIYTFSRSAITFFYNYGLKIF